MSQDFDPPLALAFPARSGYIHAGGDSFRSDPMKTFPGQTRTRAWSSLLVLILASAACCAQALAPVREVPNPPNSAAQLSKPYVVLVSLDGFRYDYAERYGARHLLELAARGASAANGMFPVFPSLTFPNHYTIVTGLYPEHHGIVNNTMHDPVLGNFSPPNRAANTDG